MVYVHFEHPLFLDLALVVVVVIIVDVVVITPAVVDFYLVLKPPMTIFFLKRMITPDQAAVAQLPRDLLQRVHLIHSITDSRC